MILGCIRFVAPGEPARRVVLEFGALKGTHASLGLDALDLVLTTRCQLFR
jgi:hypothetical protein